MARLSISSFDPNGVVGNARMSPQASRGGPRRFGNGVAFRRVGTGAAHQSTLLISPNIASVYSRIYVRVHRTPTGAAEQIFFTSNNLSQRRSQVFITTSGTFSFRNSANTEVASFAYTLGVWYRIEMHAAPTQTPNLEFWVDGVSQFSGTSGGTTTNIQEVGIGCFVGLGNDSEYDIDDWVVDDSTLPGASRVRLLLPSGPGTHNDFAEADWRAQRIASSNAVSSIPQPARSSTNPSRQTYAVDLNDIPNCGTVIAYRLGAATNTTGHTLDLCVGINGSFSDKVSVASVATSTVTSNPFETTIPQLGDAVEVGVEKTAGAGALQLWGAFIIVEVTGEDLTLAEIEDADLTVRVAVGTYTGAPVSRNDIVPHGVGVDYDVIIVMRHAGGSSSNFLWWATPFGDFGQNAIGHADGISGWAGHALRNGALLLPSGGVLNIAGADYSYLAIRDRQQRMLYTQSNPVNDDLAADSLNINFPTEASTFGIEAFVLTGHNNTVRYRDVSMVGDVAKQLSGALQADYIQSIGTGTYQVGSNFINTAQASNLQAMALRRTFATTQLWDLVTWSGNGASSRVIPVPGIPGQIDWVVGLPQNTTSVGWRTRHMSVTNNGNGSTLSNAISAIGAGSFTVGSAFNASGVLFSAWAFISGLDVADLNVRNTQVIVQTMTPNTQTCPTPEEGEDLCITIDDPVLFGSWAPGDGTRHWFAETSLDDPDTYYGGWKEDRLLDVSEIRRALSGTNYDYEIGNFSITLADDDYFVRSRLGTAPTSYFARREVEVYAVSPEGRDDQTTAKRLALGFVDQDPVFDDRSESMSVRLTCRDRIGASIGWTVNGQQKVPRRVITQINLPGAGATVLGKGAPIPYGVLSTFIQPSGNANGVTVPIPSGITSECAFFEGTPPAEFWQTGYGNLPLGPDPVTSPAISVLAGGELSVDVPAATYYAQIFPVNALGQLGDPMPFCNDGLSATVSPGNQQIQVSWVAAAGAVSYAVFLGTRFYDVDFIQWLGTTGTSVVFTRNPEFGVPATTDNITPGAAVTGDVFFAYYKIRSKNGDYRSELNTTEVYGITTPFLPNNQGYRPIRVRWKTTGAPQYEVLRRPAGGDFDRMWVVPSSQFNAGLHYFEDDLRDTGVIYLGGGVTTQPVGAVPVYYAGREVLPNQEEWGRLLIAGCAIKAVDDWYYTQTTPDFVTEITQGDGVDFIFPKDDSAWFEYFPVRYRDLTGTDGIARRWTFGYVRGAKLAMIEAGSGTVTINLRGVESDGGGTGDVLTDIHDQFRHFLRTQVSVSGEGYLTGQWANTPRFGDDEICTIDDESFEELRSRRSSEMGFPGLQGAGIVGVNGDLTTISEELKRWGTCMEARIGPNRFWQITSAAINEALTASGLASLSDEHDIHTRTFKPMPRQSELFNVIPYRYARNFLTGAFNIDGQQYVNEDSVNRHGFRQESAPIEFHYLRDPASVAYVVGLRSRRQADIPTYVSLEGSICLTGAAYDVGKYIRVDHWRGVQMSGWRNRPLWVLSNTVNPSTRRVRLECLDVTRLVPSGVSA